MTDVEFRLGATLRQRANPSAVIPWLGHGTHFTAGAEILASSALAPNAASAVPAARWIPVTSTGMTVVEFGLGATPRLRANPSAVIPWLVHGTHFAAGAAPPASRTAAPSAALANAAGRWIPVTSTGMTVVEFGLGAAPRQRVNLSTVIPWLVHGTHFAAGAARPASRAAAPNAALAVPAGRWIPVTSTGMTVVEFRLGAAPRQQVNPSAVIPWLGRGTHFTAGAEISASRTAAPNAAPANAARRWIPVTSTGMTVVEFGLGAAPRQQVNPSAVIPWLVHGTHFAAGAAPPASRTAAPNAALANAAARWIPVTSTGMTVVEFGLGATPRQRVNPSAVIPWLVHGTHFPACAKMSASSTAAPNAASAVPAARWIPVTSTGMTVVEFRVGATLRQRVNLSTVIPWLGHGTHFAAGAEILASSALAPNAALANAAGRWIPVTSTGMTIVGFRVGAAPPQCTPCRRTVRRRRL